MLFCFRLTLMQQCKRSRQPMINAVVPRGSPRPRLAVTPWAITHWLTYAQTELLTLKETVVEECRALSAKLEWRIAIGQYWSVVQCRLLYLGNKLFFRSRTNLVMWYKDARSIAKAMHSAEVNISYVYQCTLPWSFPQLINFQCFVGNSPGFKGTVKNNCLSAYVMPTPL